MASTSAQQLPETADKAAATSPKICEKLLSDVKILVDTRLGETADKGQFKIHSVVIEEDDFRGQPYYPGAREWIPFLIEVPSKDSKKILKISKDYYSGLSVWLYARVRDKETIAKDLEFDTQLRPNAYMDMQNAIHDLQIGDFVLSDGYWLAQFEKEIGYSMEFQLWVKYGEKSVRFSDDSV